MQSARTRRVTAPAQAHAPTARPQCCGDRRPVLARAAAPEAPAQEEKPKTHIMFKGSPKHNKTYYPKLADTKQIEKDWYIIDAKGQRLGRMACLAAQVICGKHLPTYTPSMDMGSRVVIINAEKVTVSGRKRTQKIYWRNSSQRPGSTKYETFEELQKRLPERIVEKAVHGMLPKGSLGRKIRLNMKVYVGEEHPHEAQNPVDITHLINAKITGKKQQAESAAAAEAAPA